MRPGFADIAGCARVASFHLGGRMKPAPSLRTLAYESLEEMIVTQVLAPGTRVTEFELSNRLGIGRTPVREALQRLAREKLVAINPRASITILEMTIERQLQLVEFRTAMEQHVVRLAALRANVDERARMLQLQRAVEDAAKIGEGGLYLRVVREIQTLLCEAARNEFLYDSMTSIYALSRQFTYIYYKKAGSLVRAAAVHAAVLKAVAARDQAAAAAAARRVELYLARFMRESMRAAAGKAGARRGSSHTDLR
jgi:DNA-binding GntR family transcriptional regulator